MKMYIANCSMQHQDFQYRVLGQNALRIQRIEMGGQIPLSGDLQSEDIDYIVEQHERYGLISVTEIDRTKGFFGLCYSVDKPVDVNKLRYSLEHNNKVLVERGVELRKQAAIATNNLIEDSVIGNTLKNLEMSVVEEKSGGFEGHDPFAEGIRIDKSDKALPPKLKKGKAT